LPLFVIGILVLFKNIKINKFKLLLYWLLISPLPSSITRDAPHVLRSITFLPIVVIIIILGIDSVFSRYIKISSLFIYSVLIIGLFMFWPKYKTYTIQYSSSWQFGYKEAISYIKNNYSNYDKIIITKKYGEPHEFILFYWPWDPVKYQNDSRLKWDFHANWYWVNGFDKFTFVNDWEISKLELSKKSLLITSPNNYPQNNGKLIDSVSFLNKEKAFDIISYE